MSEKHTRYTYTEKKLVADYKASFGGSAVCSICHQPISFSVPRNHPLSFNTDHIVPLSKGGAHAVSNFRPVHHGCNASRGNRTGAPATTPPAADKPRPLHTGPIRRSMCFCPEGRSVVTHVCEALTHDCGYRCLHSDRHLTTTSAAPQPSASTYTYVPSSVDF